MTVIIFSTKQRNSFDTFMSGPSLVTCNTHSIFSVVTSSNTFLKVELLLCNEIQGSRSPTEHGLFVWEHFVKPGKAKKIAVVAHSAGGSVTASLVSQYTDDFTKRVFAIAFTDAFGSPDRRALKYFAEVKYF